MNEIENKALLNYLKSHDINYKIHFHKAVFTVAESKSIKSKIPELHTKCLFLKDDKGAFYLAAVPADKRVDLKLLRKTLNVKKLQFGSQEELKKYLHLTPGSVSVFGLFDSSEVKLIIDNEVWNAEIVNFHPNINTATLELSHADFEKFYNSLKCEKEIMEIKGM